jgi:hypothetical protein
MAKTVSSSRCYDGSADGAGTRRDFLYVAMGAVAAVGSAAALWPFIDSMWLDALSYGRRSHRPRAAR